MVSLLPMLQIEGIVLGFLFFLYLLHFCFWDTKKPFSSNIHTRKHPFLWSLKCISPLPMYTKIFPTNMQKFLTKAHLGIQWQQGRQLNVHIKAESVNIVMRAEVLVRPRGLWELAAKPVETHTALLMELEVSHSLQQEKHSTLSPAVLHAAQMSLSDPDRSDYR